MINFTHALACAERLMELMVESVRSKGRIIEYGAHIRPIIMEFYEFKLGSYEDKVIGVTSITELETCFGMTGSAIRDNEGLQTSIALRIASTVLALEKGLRLKVQESMRME